MANPTSISFHVGPFIYRLVISNRPIFNDHGEELEGLAYEGRHLLILSQRVEPERREEVALHELAHAHEFHYPVPQGVEQRCQFFAAVAKGYRMDLEAQGGSAMFAKLEPIHIPHQGGPRVAYRQQEAAKMLGVTPGTIRKWARQGKLVTSRPNGGAVLVAASEVNRLCAGARAAKGES